MTTKVTYHFYPFDEALSCLQKAIRRGQSRDAALWCAELHLSGMGETAMKRLLIMTVEDVGIASPHTVPILMTARNRYLSCLHEGDTNKLPTAQPEDALSFLVTAAYWLAAQPKTRTSNILSVFMRATAEESLRRGDSVEAGIEFGPRRVEDMRSSLMRVRSRLKEILEGVTGDRGDVSSHDEMFLRLERGFFLSVYYFLLAPGDDQVKRREAFQVMKEAAPSVNLKKWIDQLQSLSDPGCPLETAARMCINQAMLLSTRFAFLFRDMRGEALASPAFVPLPGTPAEDLAVPEGYLPTFSATAPRALRAHLDRLRKIVLEGRGLGMDGDFIRLLSCGRDDCDGRVLDIPFYCTDIHTRRGSGFPLHKEFLEELLPVFPGLGKWPREEVDKSHGEISEKRSVRDFYVYGCIVSDEWFPGPPKPDFSISLAPSQPPQPVASLREGPSSPATPVDPFFNASRSFSLWLSEHKDQFPAVSIFADPDAEAPPPEGPVFSEKDLQSHCRDRAREREIDQGDGPRRIPIDARPSAVTEAHRKKMMDITSHWNSASAAHSSVPANGHTQGAHASAAATSGAQPGSVHQALQEGEDRGAGASSAVAKKKTRWKKR